MTRTGVVPPQPELGEEFVLRRCEYFAKVGLWPTRGDGFDPERWLANFRTEEKRHALYLLNGFIYMSKRVVEQVFVEAVRGLSRHVMTAASDSAQLRFAWHELLDSLIFLPIRGEPPRLEDSGTIFTRVARDRFELDDAALPSEEEAIQRVLARPDTPVVFVDDFVGTGSQFVRTFKRKHTLPFGEYSFEDLAVNGQGRYYCCTVVACSRGAQLIARRCPTVIVSPGYEFPEVYSVFSPQSVLWPPDLADSAAHVLEVASRRAGIPDSPGTTADWRGFGGLGLTLAFAHGKPPDATLPLFSWRSDTWYPLWEGQA